MVKVRLGSHSTVEVRSRSTVRLGCVMLCYVMLCYMAEVRLGLCSMTYVLQLRSGHVLWLGQVRSGQVRFTVYVLQLRLGYLHVLRLMLYG
jgi:hypothetical protein